MQRRLEETVEHRARLRARDLPRFADLSLDLGFAEDHRIEARRHAIEVSHRLTIANDITVFARSAGRRRGQALIEQRPDGFERGFLFRDEIELGAIASREEHPTLRTRCHHTRQRAGHFVRAMRKALAHVERRGTVVDAEHFDAHAAVVGRFEQDAQIDQLESFYEEAITMNRAAEPVKPKPLARIAPQFAEGLPAK